MKIVYAERYQRQLADILDYSVAQFGAVTAEETYRRIQKHAVTIAQYPMTGRYRADLACYQVWVPRTPFVVFYELDTGQETLSVLAIFHHARDPEKIDPR